MIPALVLASLLYGPHAPEAERTTKLSALFEPRPGQLLAVDRISLLENSQNPELIRGEIWIRPPKGQCLIIRSGFDKRDQTICKATPYKWTIDNLDSLGRLRLHATIMAEWDDGSFLSWETPYRIGNFVAAGDRDTGNFEDILIKGCKATTEDGDRSIVLEAFTGRRWKISLPEFDTPVRSVEPEIPNLMVNVDSAKKAEAEAEAAKAAAKKAEEDVKKEPEKDAEAKPESKDKSGEKTAEDSKAQDKKPDNKDQRSAGSVLGSLLSGEYKGHLNHVVSYNLPARGAFKMESGRFNETGAPQGMKGECRYIFKNAPGDPKSGAIECHDTDTLDSVYVHVPCFSNLEVKEKKAKAASKKELKK